MELCFVRCVLRDANNDMLQIETYPGLSARLPCPALSTPAGSEPDDRSLAAFWYKDDHVTPFYMVDGRASPAIHMGRHRQLSPLGRRSKFEVEMNPGELVLEVESKEDGGVYVCRVDSYRSLTRTSTVELRVLAPTPKLTIYNGDKILSDVAGPYKEDSNLELTCELTGGETAPVQLIWIIKGIIVDSTFKSLTNVNHKNDYLIRNLNRSLLMVPIICLASYDRNSTTDPFLKTSVQLDLMLRPSSVWISPSSGGPCRAGRPTDFRCTVRGSRPPAEVSWFLGGFRVPGAAGTAEATTGHIVVVPTATDHGKKLTCRAVNAALPGSAATDSVILNVTFPPKVSLSLKTYSATPVSEGDTVALTCHVTANPPTGPTQWTFAGEASSAPTGQIPNFEAGLQTLVLERLQAWHKGSYRCRANNSEGSGDSNALWLAVRHRPVCRAGQQVSYGAKRGEVLSIRCEVEAEPAEVSFRWSFSNTVVQHYNVSHLDRGLRSVATYAATDDVHLGSLFCWANNSAGEQHVPCTFTVYLPAKPNPPRDCRLANRTRASLTVSCRAGYDGGATQQFHFRVRPKGSYSGRSVSGTSATPLHKASGLPAGTEFEVTVSASNKMGHSEEVVRSYETLKEKGQGTWTWKSYRYTVTSSILALGIVVVLLVAVAINRRRSQPLLLRV